jgi:hypothetical protein
MECRQSVRALDGRLKVLGERRNLQGQAALGYIGIPQKRLSANRS